MGGPAKMKQNGKNTYLTQPRRSKCKHNKLPKENGNKTMKEDKTYKPP